MSRATNKQSLLRSIPVFADLTDDQLAVLAANLGSQTFERGETIFHQGSLGNTLYLIVSGRVRIYTISSTGQELSVTIFRTGEFFGELALLDGQPRSASVLAMEPTTMLTLHRSAFLHTITACPPIAVTVLEAMAARLRSSTTYAEHLACQSATQRVVHQVLDLASRYGVTEGGVTHIDLHLTQDDLASLSGTTRETVNRVLSGLRDQGILRVERARVSVLDVGQLRQILAQAQP